MQKGKAVHRSLPVRAFGGSLPLQRFLAVESGDSLGAIIEAGCLEPLERLFVAGSVFVLVTLIAFGFSMGGTDWDAPAPYRGGAEWPRELIGPLDRSLRGEYCACLSSYANPCGIDDLRLFRTTLAVRRERSGLSISWAALTHTLYRGDRLAARIGRTFAPLPCALVVVYAIERSAVIDFPAAYSAACGAAVVAVGSQWALSLGAVSDHGDRTMPITFGCSVDLGPLAVVMSGNAGVVGIFDTRAATRLSLDETLCLSLGYRADTEELCYGLECRRRRLLVTVGWRNHPVLGRTGVVGVGWIWPR